MLMMRWHCLLWKLKSYGISGWTFDLILSVLSNRHPRVVLDDKSLQEYPLNAGVLSSSLITFLMMLSVILLSMLMILLSIYSKCDEATVAAPTVDL